MVTNNSCDYQPTQYNVQTGGASGTLNNVAPSATSGVPVISQGSSSQPVFGTAAIAGGGTNATSFTQSNGIVTYNGTSLVNYTGPQINSSGQQTNTTQPAFLAYVSSTINNVLGDGTNYTLIPDTKVYDQGSNYTLASGTFTAPITGKYQFNVLISVVGGSNINGANGLLLIVTTAATYRFFILLRGTLGATTGGSASLTANMTAGDTMTIVLNTTDTGGKVDDVSGTVSSGQIVTFVNGYLTC